MNSCRIYINLTVNNTIVTLTDMLGNVRYSSSAGNNGFKGARKKTSFAIQTIILKIITKTNQLGFKCIQFFIKRIDQQIEPLLALFKTYNFIFLSIKEITPIAFNGCRLSKLRKI